MATIKDGVLKVSDIPGEPEQVLVEFVALVNSRNTTYPFVIDDADNPIQPITVKIASRSAFEDYIMGWASGTHALDGRPSS